MDYMPLVTTCQAKLKDISLATVPVLQADLVQFKYDGWWVLLVGNSSAHTIEIVTAGGVVKQTYHYREADFRLDFVAVGEWIYGTNWAQNSALLGRVVLHDLYSLNFSPIFEEPYIERLKYLARLAECLQLTYDFPLEMIASYPVRDWTTLWDYVIANRMEGLVFKPGSSAFGISAQMWRLKKTVTVNYVFMGMNPGGGKYADVGGSIQAGLWIGGELVHVCDVSGLAEEDRKDFWDNQASLYGRVFEASGYEFFSTGALRHPNYLRWREDKILFDPSCDLNQYRPQKG